MGSILVIGCLSLDTIHLDSAGERKTHNTVGGAGLFTAMAAAQAGAQVTLYAPKPQPMPVALLAVEKALTWIGPEVAPDNLPGLEIVHHGEGRATLLAASWGPENLLTPADLQIRLSLNGGSATDPNRVASDTGATGAAQNTFAFETVHIAALSSAGRQLEFLRYFEDKKVATCISAGTYARAIGADSDSVRQLFERCDFFFMNANEANLLLAGAEVTTKNNQLVFVTDGKNGATLYSKNQSKHIQALPANELDPTGAGDTFCGATLAGLARQLEAQESAQLGAQLAARVIEQPGSDYYF